MIVVEWRQEQDLHIVCDDGREILALRVTEGEWEICDPRREDKRAGPGLCLKPLFWPAEETASQRRRCLDTLESKWESEESFRTLLDYVAPIIQHFYVDQAVGEESGEQWKLAAQGAKLCRLFLDFLDPQRNADRAERYHTARLHLQRTYYYALACLYEAREKIKWLPEHARVRLYLGGWDVLREYRAILRTWHGVILDPKHSWLFRDVLGQSREEEMWSVLVLGQDPPHLRRFFRETAGREFVEYLIERWFLPRYDLKSAEALQHAVRRSSRDEESIAVTTSWLRTHLLSLPGLGLGALFFAASLPLNGPTWIGGQVPRGIAIVSLLLLLAGTMVSLFRGLAWLRFLLPNLFAAIMVGYFPLLLADDPWLFAIRLSDAGLLAAPRLLTRSLTFLGFPLVVGLIAFVYLLSRTEAVGLAGPDANRRALDIFLRGLSYSFLIGVVAVDVMGGRLFDLEAALERGHLELQGPLVFAQSVQGATGQIYPAVVWAFLWLALFVGVVVQVWWEERAVTESW